VSPRIKVDPQVSDYFAVSLRKPLKWGLPVTAIVSALVVAAALAGSIFMLVGHQRDHRTQVRDATALGCVRGFMTNYTTLDPFHANDYSDRVMAQATGDFLKQFKEKLNEIVIQVARAEPTTGTVVEAGVQRWNDNGSADVLVATKISTKAPDRKTTVESGNRWVVTTIEEGQQCKISNLIQVI
jgi:Mce-associated membrane protein